MHNLALALHNKGYKVTGSDDAILSHLNHVWIKKGMLPLEMGWFPEKLQMILMQ
jgi:UDP-N-acetylmuramate: L-alanyl-gamma-D-glutamyl-meso-diaminopimelate ligase